MESGGNDNKEELESGENDGKEQLPPVGKIDQEQLPTVSAASAASTQQLQQFNYLLSLNAVLIGELLSALQRIGAEVQQTATVIDKSNNHDQIEAASNCRW